LNNKAARIRQQAADLIGRIAVVMRTCDEEQLLGHLGVVLYEFLGEEYPEVLGSILGGLKGVCVCMRGMCVCVKFVMHAVCSVLCVHAVCACGQCVRAGCVCGLCVRARSVCMRAVCS